MFVVLGSSIDPGSLIDLSDAMVFIVAIPNLLGPYLLAPLIKSELRYGETFANFLPGLWLGAVVLYPAAALARSPTVFC